MRKKALSVILIFSLFLMLSSCNNSYTNEVITKKVDYEDNITIYDLEDALALAVEKCDETVIGVEAKNTLSTSFGSGVIIKSVENTNGYRYYVVTNFHVISYRNKVNNNIMVYLGKYDEEVRATVAEYDETKDVAILTFISNRLLPVSTIGDSANLKKGRFVIAVGNPYDLKTYYNTVTIGNVSDASRKVQKETEQYNYYIQHTAPINSGNSGGGLFDIHGNLVGINTWKYAETDIEGMEFAIPIHIVKNLYPQYFTSN